MTEVDLIHSTEHCSSPGMIKIIWGHLLLILDSKNEEKSKLKLFWGTASFTYEIKVKGALCEEAFSRSTSYLRYILHGLRVYCQHEPQCEWCFWTCIN